MSGHLDRVADEARRVRQAQKQLLRHVAHVRGVDKSALRMKKDAAAVNVELAHDGDVLFEFDLAEYPELREDVDALLGKVKSLALSRLPADGG